MSFEEDFIAHYGKPGMKWGNRNAQNSINNQNVKKQNFLQTNKKKIVIGAGLTAVGLIAANQILNKRSKVKANTLFNDIGKLQASNRFIHDLMTQNIRDVTQSAGVTSNLNKKLTENLVNNHKQITELTKQMPKKFR